MGTGTAGLRGRCERSRREVTPRRGVARGGGKEPRVDGSHGLDLGTIAHYVETAGTISFFFPMLRRSLVIDLRPSSEDGPMIRVMPVARSASDRLRSLKRLRPHMPRPRSLVAIPWPVYVDTLVSSGVWDRLLARLADCGSQEALRAAERALAELRLIEQRELGSLIRGERYETIWARRK